MMNWINALPDPSIGGLVVVVDGGGTKSRVAVVEASGALRGFAVGGPTNIRSAGADAAAANLVAAVGDALADGKGGAAVDAGEVTSCLVTSAAIDTQEQAEVLAGALRPLLRAASIATLPDTMGCWAATNALGPAVAVISGTGSVVVAADREQRVWRRFGGWDYLLGDEGSGYALGRAALQEVLLVGEGRSGATALSEAVLASEQANADPDRLVGDPEDIPDAVHNPTVDKAWIASFARVVLDRATAGDDHALAIVRREVRFLARAAAAGVAALDAAGSGDAGVGDGPIPIGLFGGTFNAEVLTNAFVSAVGEFTDREISAFVPERSALVGTFTIALGPGRAADEASDRLTEELGQRVRPT